LYGALVVQFYVYTYNFPEDGRPIKLLVHSVFLLETLQTALSGADLYYWFASGFGDMNHLASPYASPFDTPIMGSLVALCVQIFFVYRIWVLGKRAAWWLCVLISLCSVVGATAAFMGGIYTHTHGKFAHGQVLKVLATTWLAGNTASDLLIAAAMLYHLVQRRARDGRISNHALVSVVRVTIETNIMTTTVSIIGLLVVVLFPEKDWFVCPTYVVGKLYSNTLLVSLNNRIMIRDTSVACGGVVRSPAGTYPSLARSEPTTDIMLMDMEKSSNSFKIPPLQGIEPYERA